MNELKSHLQARKRMKTKKPKFERQDSNRYDSFKGKWRRPKGIHSKMRKSFRGHRYTPLVGYGSIRDVRGLTRNGLKPMLVSNVKDLARLKLLVLKVIKE